MPQPHVSAPSAGLFLVLQPHRSLNPVGFALLMAGIGGISFVAGLAFWLAGAWPILGFFGLDVLLVYWAFKASYAAGRQYETVQLTETELVVSRVSPRGKREVWSFQPYWLRVIMDDPPEHGSALTLSSHGRSLEIGAFLPPWERLEVARAIRAALNRYRAPDFSGSEPPAAS